MDQLPHRREGLTARPVGDELVVADGAQAHVLDPTLTRVWNRLDGASTRPELQRDLGLDDASFEQAVTQLDGAGLLGRRTVLRAAAVTTSAAVATLAMPSAFALASLPAVSTLGQTGVTGQQLTISPAAFDSAQPTRVSPGPSYVVPADGTLLTWSAYDGATGTSGRMAFALWRPTADPNVLTLVSVSVDQLFTGSKQTLSYPLDVSAKRGDVLGLQATSAGGPIGFASAPDSVLDHYGSSAADDAVTFYTLTQTLLNCSVRFQAA